MSSITDSTWGNNPGRRFRLKCDFCACTQVVWIYPTRDFTFGANEYTFISWGDWAACESCHRLIQSENNVGLLNRISVLQGLDLTSGSLAALVIGSEIESFLANTGKPRRIFMPEAGCGNN